MLLGQSNPDSPSEMSPALLEAMNSSLARNGSSCSAAKQFERAPERYREKHEAGSLAWRKYYRPVVTHGVSTEEECIRMVRDSMRCNPALRNEDVGLTEADRHRTVRTAGAGVLCHGPPRPRMRHPTLHRESLPRRAGLNEICPLYRKPATENAGQAQERAAAADTADVMTAVADDFAFRTEHGILQADSIHVQALSGVHGLLPPKSYTA